MSLFQRSNRLRISVLVLTVAAAGCDLPLPFGIGSDENAAPAVISELPRPLTQAEIEVVRTTNAFGLDLLHELVQAEPRRSHFFSPLSAGIALGMALNGTDGDTWEAIRHTLRIPEHLSEAEINQSFGGLLEVLDGLDPRVTFDVASSVWYRHDRSLRTAFEAAMRGPFGAEVTSVDFEAPQTAVRMNDWISRRTSGRITDVIENPIPRADIRLFYLLNAVYFEGDWTDRFDPSRTVTGDFHSEDGSISPVQFMKAEGGFRYAHHALSEYHAADKPYGGQAFSMSVVVPRDGFSVRDVVADLAGGGWAELTGRWDDLDGGGSADQGRLTLPRFTLTRNHDLIEPLSTMGMGPAFGPCGEFTRFFEDWAGCGRLDEVRQATFLRVDEEGTEAAAVTVVTGIPVTQPHVRADRPFVVAIRERLSGAILFLGVIVEPPVD